MKDKTKKENEKKAIAKERVWYNGFLSKEKTDGKKTFSVCISIFGCCLNAFVFVWENGIQFVLVVLQEKKHTQNK